MKKLTLILSFCLAATFAQAQQATEATVRELLAATGSADMGKQVLDNLFTHFRKDIADKEAGTFFDKMAAEINTNTLVEMVIPVYQKHYTEAELRAAIVYYQTPMGKKMLARMPLVMQESMEIGQKWGREISEKVMDRMEKEGLSKNEARQKEIVQAQMQADSFAATQNVASNPAEQKAESAFIKDTAEAEAKYQKAIDAAEKKRQKAIEKAKK